MLKEVEHPCQADGEPVRRWFSDDHLDLIIWFADDGKIIGFQFCYDKVSDEHALTWFTGRGFSHRRIDDGEGRGIHHKMTPILIPDGTVDIGRIRALFTGSSAGVDKELVEFIENKMGEFETKGSRS